MVALLRSRSWWRCIRLSSARSRTVAGTGISLLPHVDTRKDTALLASSLRSALRSASIVTLPNCKQRGDWPTGDVDPQENTG